MTHPTWNDIDEGDAMDALEGDNLEAHEGALELAGARCTYVYFRMLQYYGGRLHVVTGRRRRCTLVA